MYPSQVSGNVAQRAQSPSVVESVERCQGLMNELRETICSLESRLAPVLSIKPPTTQSVANAGGINLPVSTDSLCPLEASVHVLYDSIASTIARIQQIREDVRA